MTLTKEKREKYIPIIKRWLIDNKLYCLEKKVDNKILDKKIDISKKIFNNEIF